MMLRITDVNWLSRRTLELSAFHIAYTCALHAHCIFSVCEYTKIHRHVPVVARQRHYPGQDLARRHALAGRGRVEAPHQLLHAVLEAGSICAVLFVRRRARSGLNFIIILYYYYSFFFNKLSLEV
jgi:hypothetical protein